MKFSVSKEEKRSLCCRTIFTLPQIQLGMMEPNVCFFSLFNWIFPLFWRSFLFWYTIASILEQKTFQGLLFLFCGNLVFRLGTPFLNQFQKNIPSFFCRISARIATFPRKIVAVNLNSQQKFYDNGALAVLRRLTTVSAELPALLEK